jgi:hypothetical protein
MFAAWSQPFVVELKTPVPILDRSRERVVKHRPQTN